jgi:hypothetical protein
MSNARRLRREHRSPPGSAAHPPKGRLRRLWWRLRRWMGVGK